MQPYDNVYKKGTLIIDFIKKGIAGCGGRSRLEAVT